MGASCSQRLLSLWLRRLSTDRIARSREVSAPLVIYGKRGNAELIVAIAGTIGAAYAAAHCGEPARYACGEERTLLSPLPLAALRLPADTVASLARVGLKRIGELAEQSRAPFAARFEPESLRRLDQALGPSARAARPRGRAARLSRTRYVP